MPPDFTAIDEISVPFAEVELDDGVDFIETGDSGLILIPGSGFGEGGFGEGPFGGSSSVILSAATTEWTNIDEP